MKDPWVGHVLMTGILLTLMGKEKKSSEKQEEVLIYYHLFVFIERDLACC